MRRPDTESEAATRETSRVRNAFLAAKRSELLTPIHAVVEISERLLSQVMNIEKWPEQFVADMRVIHLTGEELLDMINDTLNPDHDRAEPDGDFEQLRSRFRHDMRNKLNPIVNYSEMWIEDADGPEFAPYLADLQLICDSGRRCHGLIDRILTSLDDPSANVSDGDMQLVSGAVERMFNPDRESLALNETGRLLVVDDDQTNREILERRLISQGHEVSLAENGTRALQMLTQQEFDLVLLDILMPAIDGFEVLLRIKADDRLRDIPVIMISALDETDVVARCIEAGAEDYLPKPFNPVMLKARIGAYLEKKRLREREKDYLRQIETERKRADELLHVILPSEIVSELKRENRVKPRRYEEVAVLFADIVNFTTYCDRNPPEDVMSLLQRLVVAWEESAARHNVEKIKTIGDAFMAASGLLNYRGDPVMNCLRCGMEMIKATHELAEGWNLRVGVHCGPVVAGVLGQRQYLFDLWGDTVNTAARMESRGTPGFITMSEAAWRKVEFQSIGTCMRKVPIKGKGSMDIYRFEGFKESAADAVEARVRKSTVASPTR